MAAFLHMAVKYKEQIGFRGQFLLEPKPKEPTKHQYDYDSQTVIGFLKTYGLEKHFKLNIEPNHTTLAGHCYEHDLSVASSLGFLGKNEEKLFFVLNIRYFNNCSSQTKRLIGHKHG